MHRLFTAIRPPEPVRAQLLDLMEGVNDARWQDEEQLHLTLRFIGEVDRHQAQDVATMLGSVRYPPFTLSLNGLGIFDRRGQPATLWAGVAPQEPVKALHRKLDQALQRAGVDPERRAYSPHITLARLGRSPAGLAELIRAQADLSSDAFEVNAFSLYESRLTPSGAVHTMVERYPLG